MIWLFGGLPLRQRSYNLICSDKTLPANQHYLSLFCIHYYSIVSVSLLLSFFPFLQKVNTFLSLGFLDQDERLAYGISDFPYDFFDQDDFLILVGCFRSWFWSSTNCLLLNLNLILQFLAWILVYWCLELG